MKAVGVRRAERAHGGGPAERSSPERHAPDAPGGAAHGDDARSRSRLTMLRRPAVLLAIALDVAVVIVALVLLANGGSLVILAIAAILVIPLGRDHRRRGEAEKPAPRGTSASQGLATGAEPPAALADRLAADLLVQELARLEPARDVERLAELVADEDVGRDVEARVRATTRSSSAVPSPAPRASGRV